MARPRDTAATARILDAAAALLGQGDGALTMDALAEAAAVSRATLYRRFPTKEALMAALVDAGRLPAEEAESPDLRERVLDAFAAQVLHHGLREATIGRVAEAAGVGTATIYRHFGDREGLITAFAEERSPRRAARALVLDEALEPEETLFRLACTGLRFLQENSGFIRIALTPDPETAALLQAVHAAAGSTRAALAGWLGRQMEAGLITPQDPRRLAICFFSLLAGNAILAPVVGFAPPEDVESVARFIARQFLDGCRASAPNPVTQTPA